MRTCAIIITLLAALAPRGAGAADDPPPLTTVPSVDLDRYLGLWHQVALIPNRFQDQCVANTTAEYTLREDGRITVLNSCDEADGKRDSAEGLARIVDTATNAKLEVSFFSVLGWRPVWGDYWVIGLDPDYQWAVVGTPSRKYGWVLARTPALSDEVMETVFGILEANGYRRDAFVVSVP